MNFKELYTRVQNQVGDTSSTTLVLIKETLNIKSKELLQKGFFKFLLRDSSLTTTSGTQDYTLPYDCDKILDMRQESSPTMLAPLFIRDFDKNIPYPTSTGQPKAYMELNEDKILLQPSAEAKVISKSTSAQDIAAQDGAAYVTIYGVSGGVDRQEVVTLSATNIVSSTLSYTKLYSVTSDIGPTGTLYFTQAVAGSELLLLYPNQSSLPYKKVKFYPIPDGSYTVYFRYQALQPRLVNDSDPVIVPGRYTDVLVNMTTAEIMVQQGDPHAITRQALAENQIQTMLKEQDVMWDYVPMVTTGTGGVTMVNSDYPFVSY